MRALLLTALLMTACNDGSRIGGSGPTTPDVALSPTPASVEPSVEPSATVAPTSTIAPTPEEFVTPTPTPMPEPTPDPFDLDGDGYKTGSNVLFDCDDGNSLIHPGGVDRGGIVNGRTLAYVGEAGPEAIIPMGDNGLPRGSISPLGAMGGINISMPITVNSSGDGGRIAADIVAAVEPALYSILERFGLQTGRLANG